MTSQSVHDTGIPVLMRPSWQQYFMEMAHLAAKRGTCLRRKVGAILVRDNQILSSGYNGSPKGVAHCDVTGCLREQLNIPPGKNHELCRGVHAEQNAIIQAGLNGASTRGATLYCTHQPCSICARMIINAEIKTVYIANPYPDLLGEKLLSEAGIELFHYNMDSGIIKQLV